MSAPYERSKPVGWPKGVVVQGARFVGGERRIVMENMNLESKIRSDLHSDDLVGGNEGGRLRAAGGVRP